jgi:Fe-S cluster biosynthesis and repair protein YggX
MGLNPYCMTSKINEVSMLIDFQLFIKKGGRDLYAIVSTEHWQKLNNVHLNSFNIYLYKVNF